jgi:MYXO-CTERM domain-containing protein
MGHGSVIIGPSLGRVKATSLPPIAEPAGLGLLGAALLGLRRRRG